MSPHWCRYSHVDKRIQLWWAYSIKRATCHLNSHEWKIYYILLGLVIKKTNDISMSCNGKYQSIWMERQPCKATTFTKASRKQRHILHTKWKSLKNRRSRQDMYWLMEKKSLLMIFLRATLNVQTWFLVKTGGTHEESTPMSQTEDHL